MEITATAILIDFCIISALLLIAKVIRIKLKILQHLYIPTALIAGILGLIGGEYFLNILPFSSEISSYSLILISVLFGTLFLGTKNDSSFGKMFKSVGDTFCLNTAAEMMFYGISILSGFIIIKPFFKGLDEKFGLMLSAGFTGGHGTSAAIGSTFEDAGWIEATTIGQTFATIGLLVGITIGIILINYAVRKGHTKVIKSIELLPEDMRSGLVKEGKRDSLGEMTVNSISIDPLSWHLCIVLSAVALAYLIDYVIELSGIGFNFPLYGLTLICGLIIQYILKLIKLDGYIDRNVVTRIGSASTDYLVAFGIASIDIGVVIKYIVPIIVLSLIGIVFTVGYLFLVSRKYFKNYWFERGIYILGWSTGVMSIAIILLRVVDPNFETGILEDCGLAWIFISFIDLAIVTLVPVFILQGFGLATGIGLILGALILIFICKKFIKNANSTALMEK